MSGAMTYEEAWKRDQELRSEVLRANNELNAAITARDAVPAQSPERPPLEAQVEQRQSDMAAAQANLAQHRFEQGPEKALWLDQGLEPAPDRSLDPALATEAGLEFVDSALDMELGGTEGAVADLVKYAVQNRDGLMGFAAGATREALNAMAPSQGQPPPLASVTPEQVQQTEKTINEFHDSKADILATAAERNVREQNLAMHDAQAHDVQAWNNVKENTELAALEQKHELQREDQEQLLEKAKANLEAKIHRGEVANPDAARANAERVAQEAHAQLAAQQEAERAEAQRTAAEREAALQRRLDDDRSRI